MKKSTVNGVGRLVVLVTVIDVLVFGALAVGSSDNPSVAAAWAVLAVAGLFTGVVFAVILFAQADVIGRLESIGAHSVPASEIESKRNRSRMQDEPAKPKKKPKPAKKGDPHDWNVTGTDAESGFQTTVKVHAFDEEHALFTAKQKGMTGTMHAEPV
ncbi:MAG: hypothetical protein AAF432_00480 [Planctomycetota bacterium]